MTKKTLNHKIDHYYRFDNFELSYQEEFNYQYARTKKSRLEKQIISNISIIEPGTAIILRNTPDSSIYLLGWYNGGEYPGHPTENLTPHERSYLKLLGNKLNELSMGSLSDKTEALRLDKLDKSYTKNISMKLSEPSNILDTIRYLELVNDELKTVLEHVEKSDQKPKRYMPVHDGLKLDQNGFAQTKHTNNLWVNQRAILDLKDYNTSQPLTNLITKSFLRYALKEAGKFSQSLDLNNSDLKGLERMDLVQYACMGLMQAAFRYSPSVKSASGKQVSFTHYAYDRIKGAIIDELRKINSLPRQEVKKINAVRNIEASFISTNKRLPSFPELTTMVYQILKQKEGPNWTIDKAKRMVRNSIKANLYRKKFSLEKPLDPNIPDKRLLKDTVRYEERLDPLERIIAEENEERIDKIFNKFLSPKQKTIFILRNSLNFEEIETNLRIQAPQLHEKYDSVAQISRIMNNNQTKPSENLTYLGYLKNKFNLSNEDIGSFMSISKPSSTPEELSVPHKLLRVKNFDEFLREYINVDSEAVRIYHAVQSIKEFYDNQGKNRKHPEGNPPHYIIGSILDFSEGRVSQIMKEIRQKMLAAMRKRGMDETDLIRYCAKKEFILN